MSRRITGTGFLVASAMLYSARYLSAAIYGSGMSGWSTDLFNAMLEYVGPGLLTWSRAAFVAGLVYLLWAEVDTLRTHRKLLEDN